MKNYPITFIKNKIIESKNIAITSHLRPDGDSICTSLALYFMGRQMGKNMSIHIKDNIPFPFNHYPDIEIVNSGPISLEGNDLLILLECANISRSGFNNLENHFKINIDHHHSNDYYGDINWVNPDAAAVACLVFALGKKMSIDFTPKIATQLYSGIVSDTGSFQFSNTNAKAFQICEKLVNYGAKPINVSELLFNNNPPEKIKLLGLVLSTLRMNKEENIAIITMFKKYLKDLNLKEIDTENILTLTRSIKGAKIILFFKEIKQDIFRVSIRSKGEANAAKIAEYFGGGGHIHAAGFTVSGKYEKLLKEIPAKTNQLLKQSSGNSKKNEPKTY
jgi:phosphoesterase RecJ-like protein